jgi:hypothetical protein
VIGNGYKVSGHLSLGQFNGSVISNALNADTPTAVGHVEPTRGCITATNDTFQLAFLIWRIWRLLLLTIAPTISGGAGNHLLARGLLLWCD